MAQTQGYTQEMATAEGFGPRLAVGETSGELATQWRLLSRATTFVAILTSPAAYLWFHRQVGWPWYWSLLAAAGLIIAFRGLVDLGLRRFIPWPSLFGIEDRRLKEEDVVARRRSWFWARLVRLVVIVSALVTVVFLVQLVLGKDVTWLGTGDSLWHGFWRAMFSRTFWTQSIFVFFLFISNFLIFLGPLMLMGISQIRGYEPGDAQWGVRLEDVRGQAEAKEEVRRVVNLWQSGEAFESAGGRRERGLLFLGSPGTGKTMLAKAIATGFNSPFVSIPGSGFAQAFLGIDALIVRWLARKARRLARKWGGQCIVFIDEIDAVGTRRSALQGGAPTFEPVGERAGPFYGPWGALNPSGDLVVESRAWRERLFELRAPESRSPYPPWARKLGNLLNQGLFPGMAGGTGQLALNQLLVTMDGIDNPPFLRRVLTSWTTAILDASYVVPRRIRRVSLRPPAPRPRREQIYFIGATNVSMSVLDPALTRPGRMGRHVWFRTPTKDDRKDIFDLYLRKVAHDADLDSPARRDEIARITNGYSPAMIEQICSMALTHAHHDGRGEFAWGDLVEAMTTIESGTAIGVQYVEEETRAVAIHEAGHAAAAHVYRPQLESSRLSIRMRGGSLGHHQAFEKQERFSQWQSEAMGELVHTLGAMAAEHVFYGETSNGVGGDLEHATSRAASMVGIAGMGPKTIELAGAKFADETEQQTRERIMTRFETIGTQLMNRTRGSADFHADPIAAVLRDPHKRALAAQTLGQAYVTAENFIAANRESVQQIADTVIAKRELYGNELVELLESAELHRPEIDYLDEASWPKL
jgi:cell division protease FtsH